MSWCLCDEADFSGLQIVKAADNPDPAVLESIAKYGGGLFQALHVLFDVFNSRRLDQSVGMGLPLDCAYGGHQRRDYRLYMARKLGLLFQCADRCTQGAASGMPQHHNERRLQDCNTILQACQKIVGYIVARHARYEKIADRKSTRL